MADLLVDAFASLPGIIRLEQPHVVEAVDAAGHKRTIEHGRHLHLNVRPTAPLQLLFTGHMDTVYAADHAFQQTRWIEDGVLGGPGVADMKGGLAIMLAALKVVEKSPLADRFGYEIVINSDEEVGSPASAALLAQAAQGKRAALTYEPAALPDGTGSAAGRAWRRRRWPGRGQAAAISRSWSKADRPMPGATRRTAAMPSSPRQSWRFGWRCRGRRG